MNLYWILADDRRTAIPATTKEWAGWFGIENRIVERTGIEDTVGGIQVVVSTVFLGLDHRFGEDGPPILWESMVFGGLHPLVDEQMRYSSADDADKGHATLVAEVIARWPRKEFAEQYTAMIADNAEAQDDKG